MFGTSSSSGNQSRTEQQESSRYSQDQPSQTLAERVLGRSSATDTEQPENTSSSNRSYLGSLFGGSKSSEQQQQQQLENPQISTGQSATENSPSLSRHPTAGEQPGATSTMRNPMQGQQQRGQGFQQQGQQQREQGSESSDYQRERGGTSESSDYRQQQRVQGQGLESQQQQRGQGSEADYRPTQDTLGQQGLNWFASKTGMEGQQQGSRTGQSPLQYMEQAGERMRNEFSGQSPETSRQQSRQGEEGGRSLMGSLKSTLTGQSPEGSRQQSMENEGQGRSLMGTLKSTLTGQSPNTERSSSQENRGSTTERFQSNL
jgi:hypothetical protein